MKEQVDLDRLEYKLIYIFLDVDGVLNNQNYIEKCYEMHHQPMHMNHVPFDPKCLKNLMLLVQCYENNNYKVKIILSSTWRLSEIDYEIVNARLAEYGLRLSGKTCNKGHRGKEIKVYLQENQDYKDFIIIDDDSFDIVDTYPDNLIQTKFKTGFTKTCLNKAIKKILGDDYNG